MRRPFRLLVVVAVPLLVALAACTNDAEQATATTRAGDRTLQGTVTLAVDSAAVTEALASDDSARERYQRGEALRGCRGVGATHDDVRAGAEVTVRSGHKTWGHGALGEAEMVNTGPGMAGTCTFRFEVPLEDMPAGEVSIAVGDHRSVTYDSAGLEASDWRVTISIA